MSVNREFVNVETRDDGVTVLRLDRPPANVTEFGGPEEAAVVGGHFREALDLVAQIPRPVIAAVNGYALGGGCELALACDLRVAADNAGFGQPEILLGIIPGGGATQRLARLVGPSRAKDIIFTGRRVGADEALRIGLVDRVVPAADVLEETLALAGELARGPSVALALAKRAIDDGLEMSLAGGLEVEHELFVEVFRTDDAKTGVASFLEKGAGKATFRGR
jgi:enoyl-CoA hydratase